MGLVLDPGVHSGAHVWTDEAAWASASLITVIVGSSALEPATAGEGQVPLRRKRFMRWPDSCVGTAPPEPLVRRGVAGCEE